MTDYEVYDKFFIDEEYDLENAPTDTYSYRSGWNNGLKRAAIIVRDEIRPTGEWIGKEEYDDYPNKTVCECSECGKMICISHNDFPNFCENCGADMRGKKNETDN